MSLFQFSACADGWTKAHGDGKPEPPSDAEFEALLERSAEISARHLG